MGRGAAAATTTERARSPAGTRTGKTLRYLAVSDTPADLVPVVICRYLIEYQTGRCSHNGSVLPQPLGFSGARSRSEGAPPHQTAIAAVSAQLTSADRCYGMQNTCCCRPWRMLTGGVLPTDLLFTSIVYISIASICVGYLMHGTVGAVLVSLSRLHCSLLRACHRCLCGRLFPSAAFAAAGCSTLMTATLHGTATAQLLLTAMMFWVPIREVSLRGGVAAARLLLGCCCPAGD